ncbi:hypothetical protein [Paenibacillus sp. EZ-K15]|uniref:hypothetical protein n=1 Tax=Paenibacillus sp. EZ-K15 TaxID=2044275 RepID=UPI0013795186|nr:hypothetical protein [Paenibacillus sp. EZ-K15]
MYVVAVLLGAAGASFAAALPLILSRLYQATGAYTSGFIILSIIAATSLALTVVMQLKWREAGFAVCHQARRPVRPRFK